MLQGPPWKSWTVSPQNDCSMTYSKAPHPAPAPDACCSRCRRVKGPHRLRMIANRLRNDCNASHPAPAPNDRERERERERVRGGLAERVNEGGGLEREEERERDSWRGMCHSLASVVQACFFFCSSTVFLNRYITVFCRKGGALARKSRYNMPPPSACLMSKP